MDMLKHKGHSLRMNFWTIIGPRNSPRMKFLSKKEWKVVSSKHYLIAVIETQDREIGEERIIKLIE